MSKPPLHFHRDLIADTAKASASVRPHLPDKPVMPLTGAHDGSRPGKLADLARNQCRWPVDTVEGETVMCGAIQLQDDAYCQFHRTAASYPIRESISRQIRNLRKWSTT